MRDTNESVDLNVPPLQETYCSFKYLCGLISEGQYEKNYF